MINRKDLIVGNMFVASNEARGFHNDGVYYESGEMLMFLRFKTRHSVEYYGFYRLRTMCMVEWSEDLGLRMLNKLIP